MQTNCFIKKGTKGIVIRTTTAGAVRKYMRFTVIEDSPIDLTNVGESMLSVCFERALHNSEIPLWMTNLADKVNIRMVAEQIISQHDSFLGIVAAA